MPSLSPAEHVMMIRFRLLDELRKQKSKIMLAENPKQDLVKDSTSLTLPFSLTHAKPPTSLAQSASSKLENSKAVLHASPAVHTSAKVAGTDQQGLQGTQLSARERAIQALQHQRMLESSEAPPEVAGMHTLMLSHQGPARKLPTTARKAPGIACRARVGSRDDGEVDTDPTSNSEASGRGGTGPGADVPLPAFLSAYITGPSTKQARGPPPPAFKMAGSSAAVQGPPSLSLRPITDSEGSLHGPSRASGQAPIDYSDISPALPPVHSSKRPRVNDHKPPSLS
ncbi:hypothetical protein CEUSTIGMA_g12092.t1 [Chlamydomonas eustigma]|uniref:Uncharacterized protein n=1 Tax=Chlamydomonas eustigma TaxID=1157962 RepID=A0A250XNK3_9CHLO|nr:hypothetical protein CEUSTIGMA_g12092.t1 [Chlamydomonas eustigma]|eukprot:GAX84671.1 hypothetical protein CEUSTIGMA_g12092.t1 [Chlamydomonas eustigma]